MVGLSFKFGKVRLFRRGLNKAMFKIEEVQDNNKIKILSTSYRAEPGVNIQHVKPFITHGFFSNHCIVDAQL